MMDKLAYAETLLQDTLTAAQVGTESRMRAEAFTELVSQRLAEAGEFEGPETCYHRSRGKEVSGFSLDEEVLHVFVTDHRGVTPPESLTDTQIQQLFRRTQTFVEASIDGFGEQLEESSPAFELADLIRAGWPDVRAVRLYLFSDAIARHPSVPDASLRGVPVTHHVWDLERLFRLDTSGLEREPITVDVVKRLGSPLPCISGPEGVDHQVHLCLIPGEFLADLYAEFGARLLERNVRSFLQARGAVNRGIRDTILTQPTRFLAYNNGISVTASAIGFSSTGERIGISRIDDFQIVNGGQTTASLYAARRKDKADLSKVQVQAKLTAVPGEALDELVSHISQFSNTQNKVTGADFSANHPFHREIEKHSRTIWAPAPDGTQRQTHWFFERARGQYADELGRAGTPAQQQQFRLANPTSQKFTKTDLAKFEHSWEQLPHVVSLGAEKNFREFMLRLAERPVAPDPAYFQRAVAKALLFRTAEKVISEQRFGGYRANIVAYAVSKLVHSTAHRIDLVQVWQAQKVTDATVEAIAELSHLVFGVISNPRGRVQNIGEWCKKFDCWKQVEELEWTPSASLEAQLIPLRGLGGREAPQVDRGLATHTPDELELVQRAAAVDPEVWFRVSNWAKETANLATWQRSLAFSLGRLLTDGKRPSVKQARQGLRLLDEAFRVGFR